MTTNVTNEHLFTRVPKMAVGEPDHQVSSFLRMVRRPPVRIG
ncbi:unannotated protein [freshwater metagenome]|uniref:Unannotated protein n=1 Tax=freshwater metagenome TaxID=449393 RepID=A0A6J7DFN3_9ZZZZ